MTAELPARSCVPATARVLRASRQFKLGGRVLSGYPILLDSSGRVVEPVAAYLAEKAIWQNISIGSLTDEAYALRDWWNWLASKRVGWKSPTDELVLEWVRAQEDAFLSKARIQRKLNVIFSFYRLVQNRLRLISDVIAEGSNDEQIRPLSTETIVRRDRRERVHHRVIPRFRYTTIPKRVKGNRPTPNQLEVDAVLEELSRSEDSYTAARDWFCAQWMVQVGLRRQGVASLTVAMLEKALQREGVLDRNTPSLEALSTDAKERGRVTEKIYRLADTGRRNFILTVTEKGQKMRDVPVPIDFMVENLHYIWDLRARFVAQGRPSRARAAGAMWISKKTGGAVTGKAIGNLIKVAFKKRNIAGSGHRLRAAFAVALIRDLYLQAKAIHGRAWDARTVLDQAAEIMGHVSPSTLKPYLNRVTREDALFGIGST